MKSKRTAVDRSQIGDRRGARSRVRRIEGASKTPSPRENIPDSPAIMLRYNVIYSFSTLLYLDVTLHHHLSRMGSVRALRGSERGAGGR